MKCSELLKEYSVDWLKQYTPASQKKRQTGLNSLIVFLDNNNITQWTPQVFEKWKSHLVEKGKNPRTVVTYAQDIRSLLTLLHDKGLIEFPVTPRVLELKHRRELQEAEQVRNKVITLLVMVCGMTPEEIAELKAGRLSPKVSTTQISLPTARGSVECITLHREVHNHLMEYLQKIHRVSKSGYVFYDLKSEDALTPKQVENIVLDSYLDVVTNPTVMHSKLFKKFATAVVSHIAEGLVATDAMVNNFTKVFYKGGD